MHVGLGPTCMEPTVGPPGSIPGYFSWKTESENGYMETLQVRFHHKIGQRNRMAGIGNRISESCTWKRGLTMMKHAPVYVTRRYYANIFSNLSREVLRMSDGLESPGIPVWQLTLCLLLTCVCCFLALVKGIDSLGKVGVTRQFG